MSEETYHGANMLDVAKVSFFFLLITSLIHAVKAEGSTSAVPSPHILLLDNCDSDFKVPPFTDSVMFLDSQGKIINEIDSLNICQNIGGNRPISVSQDGGFFVVCENVADRLSAYDLKTGNKLWSLQGSFLSASIVQNLTYALTEDGRIYGSGIQVIDRQGNVINQSSNIRGHDIVVDPNHNNIWVVGKEIKKCDMDLRAMQTFSSFTWCSVSVDHNRDGSIWVAERLHVQAGGQNRLLKVSPQGSVVASIPLKMSPLCVRADHSDNSVWVTGIIVRKATRPTIQSKKWLPRIVNRVSYELDGAKTYRYSAQGTILLEIKHGGWSIALDPKDGSVWIADETGILHFSKTGKKLNTVKSVSHDQKWLAIVPEQVKED